MSKETDEEKKFKKMALKVLESPPEDALQSKIIKLLDKQLEILEAEVNELKFKMSHNKLSEDDLQLIYDSLRGIMPEMEASHGSKKQKFRITYRCRKH